MWVKYVGAVGECGSSGRVKYVGAVGECGCSGRIKYVGAVGEWEFKECG